MSKPDIRKLMLAGHAGQLEAILSIPAAGPRAVAVVCHPHPLYGGTMDNKVVHYTSRALNDMGVATLRFNFRGVGNSQGEHDHAVGEIDDCLVAAQWMREQYPEKGLILAGFSFGAYVAARAASASDVMALISIAPAVTMYDFSRVQLSDIPWLLVQGDADEVVPPDAVRSWAVANRRITEQAWLAGAGHFFHGRLPELAGYIREWIEGIL